VNLTFVPVFKPHILFDFFLFQNNSKITEIDLSENQIGKRGMYHIAEALTENVFVTRAVSLLIYLLEYLRTQISIITRNWLQLCLLNMKLQLKYG
jgi:hypothetical protein